MQAAQGALAALAHDDPETGLEAKFSLPYTVAHGLVTRDLGLPAFEDGAWTDPTVTAVRERVTYAADPDLEYDSHESRMRIETVDGTVYERTRADPPGTHESPLSRAELRKKFESCAARVLPNAALERTWEAPRCTSRARIDADAPRTTLNCTGPGATRVISHRLHPGCREHETVPWRLRM